MSDATASTESRDAFLGGRLFLHQPANGYRAGVDPVLLAASVPARGGDRVLDLGCGVGPAGLCLATRVAGLELTGVELQPDYAALARRNAAEAGVAMQVVEADLRALPAEIRKRQFDHVLANPPYFKPAERQRASDDGREVALAGDTLIDDWVRVAAARLAPRGYLHMIQRAERLPEMLAAAAGRLGSLEVLPLTGRAGRPAHLLILRARKDGRAPFKLHAPLVLHQGEAHVADADSYHPEITAILREGAALDWP